MVCDIVTFYLILQKRSFLWKKGTLISLFYPLSGGALLIHPLARWQTRA